ISSRIGSIGRLQDSKKKGGVLKSPPLAAAKRRADSLPAHTDAEARDPRRDDRLDEVGVRRGIFGGPGVLHPVRVEDVEQVERGQPADRTGLDWTFEMEVEVLVVRQPVVTDAIQ